MPDWDVYNSMWIVSLILVVIFLFLLAAGGAAVFLLVRYLTRKGP